MREKKFWLGFTWISFGIAALFCWTAAAEEAGHYTPEYERIDLKPILQKEALDEEDYEILFRQTGLAEPGVDELYGEGRQEELFYLQQRYFEPVEYECIHANIICRSERLTEKTDEELWAKSAAQQTSAASAESRFSGNFLPTVHTGDILVTFSSHVLGWRSGHAGIVVDGEEGLTLEAINMGCNSRLCDLECWKEYPCLALLRLKDCPEEKAEEIAAYAMEYLTDIPYDLASFADRRQSVEPDRQQGGPSPEETENMSGTQCAHLVWSAFYHFGYDLDSDGGPVVTPADLYKSELLEVVQVYGINY